MIPPVLVFRNKSAVHCFRFRHIHRKARDLVLMCLCGFPFRIVKIAFRFICTLLAQILCMATKVASAPFLLHIFKTFEKWVLGHCCPERDDVLSRPLSCPDMPESVFYPGVFASIVLQPSVACCLIFHPLYFADSHGKKRLLHIHQTTVKQGGLQKRRSSRFIRAIGLHWFHKHIGPVSCFFSFYSPTIPQLL